MNQLSKLSNAILKANLILLMILFVAPMFGQKESKEQSYKPKNIENVFKLRAVTPQEMTERANHHPYMKGEIVVAIELQESKSSAMVQVRDYEWSKLFSNNEVKPLTYLMTKELQPYQSVSLVHLSLPDGLNVFDAMNLLDGQPGVLWSSPNFYFEGDPREIVPNDPSYGSQYHHPLMQNDLAWNTTYGSSNIMLGITDDGVETTHSDLTTNIWVNPGEIAGNGIDDDNNGYIDDVNGWDFSGGNNDPNPNSTSNDHGTHVAGICAGRTNNSIGIAGVSGHSKILPIQFYAGGGSWTAAVCNGSFTYAADNGANIVNTSYNINGFVGDPVFTAGMQYMHDNGVLHFNSGGNGSELNPARQAFHQTLLVVNTDASDIKSSSSNWGTGMDISAPGSSIYSTVTSNGYGYKSGTSMAAPNAAGAAALIWSANPSWNSYQVAAQLLATADDIDPVNPSYAGLLGSGRVNTYQAMTANIGAPIVESLIGMPAEGSVVHPSTVTDFTVSFSQVMDPATVNNIANFELRGAGPDNNFGTGDDQLYTLSTSTTYQLGTNEMTFTIAGPAFIEGFHRLSLISGGLANPHGTALDGDENGTGGDDFIRNFTISTTVCSGVTSFPYAESFESGIGSWLQSSGDDFDWSRLSGGTGSSGTGPSSAYDGSFYMYTESSSPNYPNKTAGFYNRFCFASGGLTYPTMDFAYHMYGGAMGTLTLQVSTDGSTWTDEWSLSGDQGNTWHTATVDLSAYGNTDNVLIRWWGLTSSSYTSDMSIDNIEIYNGGSITNDVCAGSIAINEVTDLYFDTSPATASGDHPGCGGTSAPIDLWYAYTATSSGIGTFGLCGSSYDTRLAIWDACGGSVLACNDDNGPMCGGLQSSIAIIVTTGNTYYVQVGGYETNTGTGNLTITVNPATWTGTSSTVWSTSSNWDFDLVPNQFVDVLIPASLASGNWPTFSGDFELGVNSNDITMNGASEMIFLGNLTIPLGRTLTCNANNKIYLEEGDWINLGIFNEGMSTVDFTGTSNSTINTPPGGPVYLINETFASWPGNWNGDIGTSNGYFNQSTTSNAGGTSPEAMFTWVSGTTTKRLYHNPVNTTGLTSLTLDFRHMVNDYSGSAYTVKVQYSTDGTNWFDSNWSVSPTGNISATQVSTTLTSASHGVGASNYYIAFTITGNLYNINYWYFDNAQLSYNAVGGETFYNLTDSKSGAEVITNGNITINHDLVVRPGARFTNSASLSMNVTGNVLLMGDNTGKASFIDNGTLNVSGTTTVNSYYTDGRWHFLSSPVSNAVSNIFMDIYLKTWHEDTYLWEYITPTDYDLDPGKGFEIWSTLGNPIIDYVGGDLNTGDITIPITATDRGGVTGIGPDEDEGWNFVGNPYPSAIDLGAPGNVLPGYTWTNLDYSVYLWNGAQYASYNPFTGASINSGTRYVPSMQSFFIRANDFNPGLMIPNSARLHTAQSNYKNSWEGQLLKLQIDGNEYSDEILILTYDQATKGFDSKFDAHKMWGIDEAPQLYSISSGDKYGVNVLPEILDNDVIPVGLRVGVGNEYVINLIELQQFENYDGVWLEDLKTGIIVDLIESPAYSFVSEPGDEEQRFLIHFMYPQNSNSENNEISIYSFNDMVYIRSFGTPIESLEIYDMLGHNIINQENLNTEETDVEMNSGMGYYLVKVFTSTGIKTEKVFIR